MDFAPIAGLSAAARISEFFDLRLGKEIELPLSLLLTSSFIPVVKVILVGLLGLICSLPAVNILPAQIRKGMSKLVYCVFLPAFIFVRLGEAVTLHHLIQWWFLPVNVILASSFGCLLGVIVAKVTRAPPEYTRVVAVLTGIGNQGNMPIVLLSAICSDSRNPFGPKDVCDATGVAYIALGMWMAALIVWGVVYNALSPPEDWVSEIDNSIPEGKESALPLKDPFLSKKAILFSAKEPLFGSNAHRSCPDMKALEEGKSLYGNGNSNSLTIPLLGRYSPRRSSSKKLKPSERLAFSVLSVFLRPPLLAACTAMVLGVVPAAAKNLFGENGNFRFAADTIGIPGQALVPCILMVIGGNMASGPTSSNLSRTTIFGIVVSKMFLLPVFGMVVVSFAEKLNFLPPANPMFRFALLLQHTMPASVEIGTCCSLHGFGEKETSSVLFFQHIVAVFSMTGFMLLYLYMLFG